MITAVKTLEPSSSGIEMFNERINSDLRRHFDQVDLEVLPFRTKEKLLSSD